MLKRLADAGIEAVADLDATVDGLLDFLILHGQARFRLEPVVQDRVFTPRTIDQKARHMAELSQSEASAFTFNPWHEALLLSPIDRHLFPLLDGTRSRDELVEAMLAIAREHNVQFEQEGQPLMDDAQKRDVAERYIEELPRLLAEMKLSTVR